MAKSKHRDSLIWGVIFIAIGVIFLLETMHVRLWHYIWRFWPIVFIIWGASKLYSGLKDRGQRADSLPPQDKGHEI